MRSTIPLNSDFGADRAVDEDGVSAEFFLHRVDGHEVVGADAVHLVDERDTRNAIAVRLAPDSFRLGLNACDGIEHSDSAVENAQRALHFDREVDVARGVDDVDLVSSPLPLSNKRWSKRR